MRKCNECTLCCRLLPVSEMGKPANTKCTYQRISGCTVYERRPWSCRFWSCEWLRDETIVSRPDKSHYVIDPSPDYIELVDDIAPTGQKIPVIQIWVDPKHPDAYKNPELMAWLNDKKATALIRYDSANSLALFPPSVTGKGWLVKSGVCTTRRKS